MEKEKEKKNNKKPRPHMFSSQVKFQPFRRYSGGKNLGSRDLLLL